MKKNNRLSRSLVALLAIVMIMGSACKEEETAPDTQYLAEFHEVNFSQQEVGLDTNKLSLYVDYSTCCALGQHSQLFQEVSISLVNRTTDYYAIKGSEIEKVDIQSNGGVYTLLRNIQEFNYADLKRAAEEAANGNSEAVLLTDGEYYTQTIAKGHDNDPYLSNAFKKWILKGHDIHFIIEPYTETYKGVAYNKKRFYIIFTDDRMSGNIYNTIINSFDLTKYPDVDLFHLSASHPQIKYNGNNSSTPDDVLQCKSEGFGTYEIQDWKGCDWKTIEDMLVCTYDSITGEPLSVGATIMQLGIDKNSFGYYRINGIGLKVYDINTEYFTFYSAKMNNEKAGKLEMPLTEIENFMEVDAEEFNRDSKINIRFNKDYFDPKSFLKGKPYNYFKIDLTIGEVIPNFEHYEDKFSFQSISKQGEINKSVASSIRQCFIDEEVIKKIKNQVIYSIYIKSEQK